MAASPRGDWSGVDPDQFVPALMGWIDFGWLGRLTLVRVSMLLLLLQYGIHQANQHDLLLLSFWFQHQVLSCLFFAVSYVPIGRSGRVMLARSFVACPFAL